MKNKYVEIIIFCVSTLSTFCVNTSIFCKKMEINVGFFIYLLQFYCYLRNNTMASNWMPLIQHCLSAGYDEITKTVCVHFISMSQMSGLAQCTHTG